MKAIEALKYSRASDGELQLVAVRKHLPSRPPVITPVTLDNQSVSPKLVTLELRSGATVRSSDLVRRSQCYLDARTLVK